MGTITFGTVGLGNQLVIGASLCLLLYVHVYVLPTLVSGNFEDSDHNAKMRKMILLVKPKEGMLLMFQHKCTSWCICACLCVARIYMGGAKRLSCLFLVRTW